MRKRLLYVASSIFFIFTIITVNMPVFADVGDFESYDSGSSSWDSGSSWSSSSWDSDDYSYSSGSGDADLGDMGTFLIFLIIVIVVFISSRNKGNNFNSMKNIPVQPVVNNQEQIIEKIKQTDELFNPDEFTSWARDLFIKLQYAWSDRDWSAIRVFESNELFEQHSAQLERYKQNKQINKLERVSVNWVKFFNFEQRGDKDVLSVLLNSKMIDYIIDETTNQVIKGDKETNRVNTYKLTFIRKTGVKTKSGTAKLNTTNCPNCGAPTQITSAGKCEYCGSVITTGEYNWVLSNLEPYHG